MARRRSWWGWGWEDQALDDAQSRKLAASVGRRLGAGALDIRPAPRLTDLDLRPPRVRPPATLAPIVTDEPAERARHTYGRSYRDVVRGSRLDFPDPVDLVAMPRTEADVVALLDWCSDAGVAALPYGGGSSVVGGVEPPRDGRFPGTLSIDLTLLDRVVEIDRTSRAARIQAGALGPVLEDQLRPEGLTLRHYPQSFEFSTLGGWIATRSGGHFATLATHIDDLVESMRVVTPAGVVESRRLPGSGAGPSPDRMFLGSEGAYGIITEAWMRLQDRPVHKASAGVRYADYGRAVDATRALSQSGLHPTNCRLLDPVEAALSAGMDGSASLLMVGFESADHPVGPWIERAVELCRDHGGEVPGGITVTGPASGTTAGAAAPAGRDGEVGAWRSAFLKAPYTRDAMVRMSMIVETFETACTWDAFAGLHAEVTGAVGAALDRICGGGVVTCRFTHVYPDGPAPYFSVFATGRAGSEVAQWDEIKAAAADAILGSGGTITHHHAVGRDHDAWYRRQRPELVGRALGAVKATLDPAGICNPGVLV